MPITKTQERAIREAIQKVKQRPSSLNEDSPFDPLHSIGITREQYNAVRDHLREKYDIYTGTWVVPVLEGTLPADRTFNHRT